MVRRVACEGRGEAAIIAFFTRLRGKGGCQETKTEGEWRLLVIFAFLGGRVYMCTWHVYMCELIAWFRGLPPVRASRVGLVKLVS